MSNIQEKSEVLNLNGDNKQSSDHEFDKKITADGAMVDGLKISIRKIEPSKKPRGVLAE